MTQEQFAEKLFVSRTAVSKWETGRGMPSMESLQMIAKLFHITLDDLLSTEEIVLIAESENKENIKRFASYMDGVINLAALLGLLLPLYKVELNNVFYSVPLYQYEGWLAILYWVFPIVMSICGIIQIILNKSEREKTKRSVNVIGVILNACAVFILILGGQPYPAVMFFALLLIKGTVTMLKR